MYRNMSKNKCMQSMIIDAFLARRLCTFQNSFTRKPTACRPTTRPFRWPSRGAFLPSDTSLEAMPLNDPMIPQDGPPKLGQKTLFVSVWDPSLHFSTVLGPVALTDFAPWKVGDFNSKFDNTGRPNSTRMSERETCPG